VIQFEHLAKGFGKRRVLEDFSLTIPEGETTVLMGYSGTGKSVLLKHIVGLLEPDGGRVVVDGLVVHELGYDELMQLRGRIGFVFQFAALFDSLSVADNVALGLRRQGLEPTAVTQRVDECLRLVELEDSGERYPAELSGGMRKRVGIARAIALRPRYILYDEPTTGLDPVTTAAMNDLMIRARRELGATSVVVTHDLSSAFTVADRIAFLDQGRVRQAGTAQEIRASGDPMIREFLAGYSGRDSGGGP
jgi:phospholipid/cholesterol/gamma-HCH transport system ATP-binding protein